MSYLLTAFDFETTCLIDRYPLSFGWFSQECDGTDVFLRALSYGDFKLDCKHPSNPFALNVHGLDPYTLELASVPTESAADIIPHLLNKPKVLLGWNIEFDLDILARHFRVDMPALRQKAFCCMNALTLPLGMKNVRGQPKKPKLVEAYELLFPGKSFQAHGAGADSHATMRIHIEAMKRYPTYKEIFTAHLGSL